MARRSRTHQAAFLRQVGLAALAAKFTAAFGLTVRYGPCHGLKYTPEAARDRLIICKLLGSYEKELHRVFETADFVNYDCIVDVGCAEGYYAIGLALRTRCSVFAFDAAGPEIELARGMALQNGVADRVRFGSWCSPESLKTIVKQHAKPLVFSDCEGYETELFTEEVIPALRSSDLLIELHGTAKDILPDRLQNTHEIELIPSTDRSDSQYEELRDLSPDIREFVLDEFRKQQYWLWARACS